MTNSTAPATAIQVAPFRTHYSYYKSNKGIKTALLQVIVGNGFDEDFCPASTTEVYVEAPLWLAGLPGAGAIIRNWLEGFLKDWTFLTFYNVTGACCPVSGYPETDTPF